MSLVLTNTFNGSKLHDPFAVARELLSLDPFVRPVRSGGRAFAPAFDVKETGDGFVLTADLPGIAESDLDISLHDNVLTVAGRRTAEPRKDNDNFSVCERRFGAFSRSFTLPDTADGEKIEAKLDFGVLTLAIGKKPEAKPRKIALKK